MLLVFGCVYDLVEGAPDGRNFAASGGSFLQQEEEEDCEKENESEEQREKLAEAFTSSDQKLQSS